jgi:trans-aconitate methyltransferase
MNVIEAWKYSNVFVKQLKVNLEELKGPYPPHWYAFIELLNIYKPKTLLDVGCGCGAVYELCRKELPYIEYFGIDYSKNAIELAKKTWGNSRFSVKDCLLLTEQDVSNYDVIHLGALLDVLPNGDDVLEYILKLSPKSILITRMKLTERDSYYNTYEAYNEIMTCEFYHNKKNFKELCEKYNYEISNIRDNFYLKRK